MVAIVPAILDKQTFLTHVVSEGIEKIKHNDFLFLE